MRLTARVQAISPSDSRYDPPNYMHQSYPPTSDPIESLHQWKSHTESNNRVFFEISYPGDCLLGSTVYICDPVSRESPQGVGYYTNSVEFSVVVVVIKDTTGPSIKILNSISVVPSLFLQYIFWQVV